MNHPVFSSIGLLVGALLASCGSSEDAAPGPGGQDAGTDSLDSLDATSDAPPDGPTVATWCNVEVEPPLGTFTAAPNPDDCDCIPGTPSACGATLVGQASGGAQGGYRFEARHVDGGLLAPRYGIPYSIEGQSWLDYRIHISTSSPTCESLDPKDVRDRKWVLVSDETREMWMDVAVWSDADYEAAPSGTQAFVFMVICSDMDASDPHNIKCLAYHYQAEPIVFTKRCCTSEDACTSTADCCGRACRPDSSGKMKCSAGF